MRSPVSSRAYATRVRGEAGAELHHSLECAEGLAVAAELDQGVADDAERPRRARQQLLRAPSACQRRAEVVPDERERAEAEDRRPVVAADPDGASQRGLRARQERGVRGLPPAELVGEAEPGEELGVLGVRAHLLLEAGDGRGADAAGRPRERPLGERPRGSRGRRGGRTLGEDAADQASRAERDGNRASHQNAVPCPTPRLLSYRWPVCS